jgi:hypothetical protein
MDVQPEESGAKPAEPKAAQPKPVDEAPVQADPPPRSLPDEHRVRRRAHEIWVLEGKPEGRHVDHWLRARWEVENEPK